MNSDPHQMGGFIAALLAFYAVIYLIQAAIFMIPAWFIAKKAGFSPWLALLCIFPLTGVVFFYIMAFGDWKVVPAPQQAWMPPPPNPPQLPYPPQG